MYSRFLHSFLSLFLFLFISSNIKCSPAAEKVVIDSGSIKQQFDFVIGNSTLYSEYRAVKAIWLSKLKSHSLDTIQKLKTELQYYRNTSSVQASKLDSLSQAMQVTVAKLDKATHEKNTLRLFGIKIAKYQYNTLVVLTIVGLLALLSVGFIAYKKKKTDALQNSKDLVNIKEEFEMFRKRALEREQKMARRHLDEILKYKEQSQSVSKKDK